MKEESHTSSANEATPTTKQKTSVSTTLSYMNIVCLGHAYLTYDMTLPLKFFKKYRLKFGEVYVEFLEDNEKLIKEALATGIQNSTSPAVGGSTINVAQCIQWLLYRPNSVVFLGTRAKDENSESLLHHCRDTQILFRLEEHPKTRTSILLVLRHQGRYCQVMLSTKNIVPVSSNYIDKPSVTKMLERASVLFTAASSVLVMKKVMKQLAYYSAARCKLFVLLITKTPIIRLAEEDLHDLIQYTDILFLNKTSATKLIDLFQLPLNMKCCEREEKCLVRTLYLWITEFSFKNCTVILTDGLKRVYYTSDHLHSTVMSYSSKYFKEETFVDDFGCVSGFVGGFLAMLVQGGQLTSCFDYGFFLSNILAARIGVAFPFRRLALISDFMRKEVTLPDTGRTKETPFTIFQTPWKEVNESVIFEEDCGYLPGSNILSSATETIVSASTSVNAPAPAPVFGYETQV